MRSMIDRPRVFGQGYRMNMNKEVASAINVGLDGQTKAYINVKGKDAKRLFASKYVPMDDGTDVLTSAPQRLFSQKGYGAIPSRHPADVPDPTHRIGFNNTLVSTANGGVDASCAYTKTYPNHMVYTDFPKGPGGVSPNPMWEDGTYDEMLEQVTKRHNGLPDDVNFAPIPDARKAQFNLQALTGASAYGDALFRQNLIDGLGREEDITLEGEIRSLIPTISATDLEARKKGVRIDREAIRIARQMRLDKDSAIVRALATQVVEDKLKPVEEQDIPLAEGPALQLNAGNREAGSQTSFPRLIALPSLGSRSHTQEMIRRARASRVPQIENQSSVSAPIRGHQRSGVPAISYPSLEEIVSAFGGGSNSSSSGGARRPSYSPLRDVLPNIPVREAVAGLHNKLKERAGRLALTNANPSVYEPAKAVSKGLGVATLTLNRRKK